MGPSTMLSSTNEKKWPLGVCVWLTLGAGECKQEAEILLVGCLESHDIA
jgi:hypothetical protein